MIKVSLLGAAIAGLTSGHAAAAKKQEVKCWAEWDASKLKSIGLETNSCAVSKSDIKAIQKEFGEKKYPNLQTHECGGNHGAGKPTWVHLSEEKCASQKGFLIAGKGNAKKIQKLDTPKK